MSITMRGNTPAVSTTDGQVSGPGWLTAIATSFVCASETRARAGAAEAAPMGWSISGVDAVGGNGLGLMVNKSLRPDSSHLSLPAPVGLLAWTTYVQPIAGGSIQYASAASAMQSRRSDRSQQSDQPARSTASAAMDSARGSDAPLGVHRQRFYPEQWRRAIQPQLDNLLRQHQQPMQWVGWDRSLPRLYISVEQLTRVMLDLVQGILRRVASSGQRSGAMCFRVAWQSGATQSLVMVLEHSNMQLSPAMLAGINAPLELMSANQSASKNGHEFLRVRRLVSALGGSLSANECRGGGALFRISLPIDERITLVRSWLEQASRQSKSRRVAQEQRSSSMPVNLFIVGRKQRESLQSLNAADARLQSLAGTSDFVYRTARGRWLWLTTEAALPSFLNSSAWQFQLVRNWQCPASAEQSCEDEAAARSGIAQAIASDINRLMGLRVPPLDQLNAPGTGGRRFCMDDASAIAPNHVRKSVSSPRDVAASPAMARQRRWRYPI